MKKFAAYFFIFLANISLLAYAVIPHHHHDKMMVAVVDVAGCHSHEHHSHDHHDSHSEEGYHCSCHQSEDCLLNEKPMVVFRGKGSELCSQKDYSDDAVVLLCDALPEAPQLPQPAEVQTVFCTCQTDISPGAYTSCNGLRAPPTC